MSETCEHCDASIGFESDQVPPARCGSGPNAPYGWCCRKCAPATARMFGGSPNYDARPLDMPGDDVGVRRGA